ncbi:hypothetical protein [Streptomyces sp. 8N616]|uniref:hypothetical protein n=1 Tax=Streptomyces sp. 8N616 TaxID=3457414 RepID=UPI003FD45825
MAAGEPDEGSGGGGGRGRGRGPGGGGTRIGDVTGSAVVIGSNNQVSNTAGNTGGPAAEDEVHERLLLAVQQLRDDLGRLVETPEITALRDELDDTEGEIRRTGQADPVRFARLRQLLQDAATGIGALASGVAVGQALAALGG